MASILAKLPPPPLFANGRHLLLSTLQKVTAPGIGGRQGQFAFVAKATSDTSDESSTSLVKSVQSVWEKSEDRIAVIGLGFSAIVGLWAIVNFVSAIDKLPLIPTALELVGILFSSWFVYRNLLFKPDREEFFRSANKSLSDILGGR
ncbi:protein CURVATURE THYLAKOID 1C, chloroplastic isoform X1 [Coffea eugenioides]|uniref:Protein CURVATURE THYLAKOID 1C, chloroplastic-like isoform X1 n=1 Tax=Coffea arabica TaxID=13443 RepID=A0ABM4U7E4_COFAR|nr:protein CURVATURE THYLAKOID 1C, chloroplastic isoform X1 [Coffea arabica]XP_027168103.1 protein CURVATURE THYLAKOID 1C, chloroplastic isoform X1 [Coffea eugenioides]